MHLVALWARPLDIALSVLTVDHGLRVDSASEARRVAGWAGSLGIHHHVLIWQGEKPKTGLQAKARTARYDLMATWCKDNGADGLMTGHTMDDQAETVVMRMRRTNSPESIASIRPMMEWNGLRVFRPLLGLRRETLRSFLTAQNLIWIDDPSNENHAFERVRVRKELHGQNPEALANMAEDALGLANDIADKANMLLRSATIHPEGYFAVPREVLADATVAEAVIRKLLGSLGGSVTERSEREKLVAWCLDTGGSRRTLGGVLVNQRQRDILFIREPGRIAFAPDRVPESGTLVWDGRFVISAAPGTLVSAACRLPGIQPMENVPRVVSDGLPAIVFKSKKPQLAHLLMQTGMRVSFPAKPLS
jgi:tRNA(Ile)-lysidine synthase